MGILKVKNIHGEEQPIGKISSGISEGTFAREAINFIRSQLPCWRDDLNRPTEDLENQLTLQLCKFLNSQAKTYFPMIHFAHEEYQPHGRSVDIGVSPSKTQIIEGKQYTIYDPIILIECKRLPAPTSDREKEYVTGGSKKSGGIQRFKLGLHGKKFSLAAMIGYVQKKHAYYWFQEINKWILSLSQITAKDHCAWTCSEQLNLVKNDILRGLIHCLSIHRRKMDSMSNDIEIQHLFIDMKFDQNSK